MFGLIESVEQLERVLTPIFDGRVTQAGFDTETTEVKEKRFTPWGTDTRFCGFSVSYDYEGVELDMYAPVRHRPYDWRRPIDRMRADNTNEGSKWADALLGVEGVTTLGTWEPGMDDPNLPLNDVLALIQRMFDQPNIEWLAQNWPFDTRMMLAEGITLPWERMEDTQALSVFTDPRPVDLWDDTLNDGKGGFVHGGHSLKHLGETWCGIKPEKQALLDQARRALGEGSSMLNDWSMLPLRTVIAPYACMDTRLLLKVAAVCRERHAYQEPQTRELLRLHKLERRHVAAMEQRGIAVNQELCLERGEVKRKEVEELVISITELAGITLNLGHGETLATQLYDELGFPTYRGNRNTREATLKHVRTKLVVSGQFYFTSGYDSEDGIKLLDAILTYRKAFKELTSFYRPLTQFGETGRVHTTLSPIAARTTRYAAEKPNVMQMGKPRKAKTPEATYQNQLNSVRHLFQPGPDHCYGLYDYSGQEMRLMAHYALAIPSSFEYRFTWGCTMASKGNGKYPPNTCRGSAPHGPKDDYKACQKFRHAGRYPNYSSRPAVMGLVEGFMGDDRAEFDPHNIMMQTLARLGVELDRDKAKNIDFAIPYGVGIGKAADMIDSDTATAKRIISIFWDDAYTELGRVKQFISERLRNAGTESPWSHQEFIRTLHGARIYLADGFKGMNYVIQRSGREILLKAIVSVGEYLERHGLDHDGGWQLVMPIHDELMFRIHRDALDRQVSQDIARLMVEAGSESLIPMVVQPSVAYESWAVKEVLPKDWGCDGVELYGRRDPWSE